MPRRIMTGPLLVCSLFLSISYLGVIHTSVHAQPSVRAWKDESSFGLENDHLFATGAKQAYVYDWGWNSLTFKDTQTVWKLPWNELSGGAKIGLGVNGYNAKSIKIEAVTEQDKAYISYQVIDTRLKWNQTYIIFPGKSYIYEKVVVTSLVSVPVDINLEIEYISYIAGDLVNDRYFIPGFSQGQFTGNSRDQTYSPATEGWIAMWDNVKQEGVGIATPDRVVQYRTYDWFGLCLCGEGARIGLEHLHMEPFATSKTFEAYLYFYVGNGYTKVKQFYDSIRTLPPIVPLLFPRTLLALLSGTEGELHVGDERQLKLNVVNLGNKTVTYRVKCFSEAVRFIGTDEVSITVDPGYPEDVTFSYKVLESGTHAIVVVIYQDSTPMSQSSLTIVVSPNPSFWEVPPPWYLYLLLSAMAGYLVGEAIDRLRRKSK